MTTPSSKKGKTAGGVRPRSLSRMAAVLAGTDVSDVIYEFVSERFVVSAGDTADGSPPDSLEGADAVFFSDLLKGVVRRQRDIDPQIDQQLAAGWRLVRVDSILRAILRAGMFELLERPDVPARVIINEYINVAHAFFSEDEPRVVNGVLDRIAHKVRGTELKKAGQ